MFNHKCFLLFFLLLCFLSSITIEARPIYLYHNCSTAAKNFSTNSTFKAHRTTLLSSLASANANFYNTTVHGGGDTIYGLFMCRGDVSLQVCHLCVVNATQRLPSECPFSKEAVIWYHECMLCYSNISFFTTTDKWPTVAILNLSNISNSDQPRFKRFLISSRSEGKSLTVHSLGPQLALALAPPLSSPSQAPPLAPEPASAPELAPASASAPELAPAPAPELAPAPASEPGLAPASEPVSASALAPELAPAQAPVPRLHPHHLWRRRLAWIILIVLACLVVGGIILYFAYYLMKIRMKKSHRAILRRKYFGSESTALEHLEFNLATIEAATNKFSNENSLGRGGFGQVFKGVLSNGQEIAVKRLSIGSGQGADEFKNEVLLIARLQHRNLVVLLGFCIEEQEKLLVYEYVPNRSLDYFLFGSQNTRVLDWMERSKIIGGVARGILYLHEYSRLKIIHRDLKPSNILLDDEMNPKISDFGLAKMVGISDNERSTNRIVGTYGYMSPEYAMFGQYSEKSDVFSFGVIVLEIISRRKNTGCDDSQYASGLLSYTWKKWRDDKLVEVLDSNLTELGSYNEVIKCIQIGLLCVQENPNTRPSMSRVVSYLNNDFIQLPLPKEPAFFLHGEAEPITANESGESCSINEASVSEFFPR